MSCTTVIVRDPEYLDHNAMRGVLVGPWGEVTCHAWDGVQTGRMEQAYHDSKRDEGATPKPQVFSASDRERIDPYEPWEHFQVDSRTYRILDPLRR